MLQNILSPILSKPVADLTGGVGSLIQRALFYYPCKDNAASTVITDISGKGNHGTLSGGNTSAIARSGPNEDLTGAFNFGASGYYGSGIARNYTSTPLALTFAAWIRTTEQGYRYYMGPKDGTNGVLYCVLFNQDGTPRFNFRNGDSSTNITVNGSGGDAIDNGNWHHMAMVITPSLCTLYRDGVSIGTPAVPPSTLITTTEFLFGGYRLTGATGVEDFVDMDMAGVGVWAEALSSDDISELATPGTFDGGVVTNGGFESDTVWTKGEGWSISGGQAVRASAAFGSLLSQAVTLEGSTVYRITFDIISISGGSVNTRFYGTSTQVGASKSTVGEYTTTLNAANNTTFAVGVSAAGVEAEIDNVRIEVA